MRNPYKAEHVGSFLRPPDLLEARARFSDGKLSRETLSALEDSAILQVLDKQRQLGLGIFSDGELRRGSWLADMNEAVAGFVPQKVMLEWKGPGGATEGSQAFVAGERLRKLRKMTGHETPFLKIAAPGPFKVTLPAPSNFMLASYRVGISDAAYPDPDELLTDLVGIVRDEIQWLSSQGVTYIQLDAPFYSYYIDSQQRDQLRRAGRDPEADFKRAIAGDNSAIQGLSRENVTVALHICRGNNRSRWYTQGGYELIAEKLFEGLDVDTFLFEYDSDRSGGFEPLRAAPAGKVIVLGLVTTKSSDLESQEDLMRRIDQAARHVALENLAISPQCGFASVAAGNLLSIDDQWRKLGLVVETAQRVWGHV